MKKNRSKSINIKTTYTIIVLFIFAFFNPTMAQTLPDSIVLHYNFTGNAFDQSGNSFHGTVNNTTLTNDVNNNSNAAYHFNGINSHITVPYDPELQPDFPFTISLWIKNDTLLPGYKLIYCNDEFQGNYSGFWIGCSPVGSISAGYGDGFGQSSNDRRTKHSNTLLNTGTWYHITASFNGLNDIDLYIDCELDEGYYSGSGSTLYYHGSPGIIGRNLGHNANNYFQGSIDDIQLFKDSLTTNNFNYLCNEDSCLIDLSVSAVGNVLTSNATGVSYQWLNCKTGMTVMVGDTLQSLSALFGTYAVEITQNGCVDTSACFGRISTILGISEENQLEEISVYPNPTRGLIHINLGKLKKFDLKIVNVIGELIYQDNDIQGAKYELELNTPAGVYFIEINSSIGKKRFKIVKN